VCYNRYQSQHKEYPKVRVGEFLPVSGKKTFFKVKTGQVKQLLPAKTVFACVTGNY